MKNSTKKGGNSAVFNTLNAENKLIKRVINQNRLLAVLFTLTIIAVVISNTVLRKDNFYIVNKNSFIEIKDPAEIARFFAIDQLTLVLENNEHNIADRFSKITRHTSSGSNARTYILKLLQDKYVERTQKLGIIRNFYYQDSKVETVDSKFHDVFIKGTQINYTIDGRESKEVSFKLTIAQIPPDPERGFDLGLIITDITELETLIL